MKIASFGLREDLGKPRNRSNLLLEGLQTSGATVHDITLRPSQRLKFLLLPLLALSAPRADAVLLRYPYYSWILNNAAFLKRRLKCPLIIDAMVSHYDTYINDRKVAAPDSPLARSSVYEDHFVGRIGDLIVADTVVHARALSRFFECPMDRFLVIPLGSPAAERFLENEPHLADYKTPSSDQEIRVVYTGSFVPLHGVDVMIAGFRMAADKCRHFSFDFYGTGQHEEMARRMAEGIPRCVFHGQVAPEKAFQELAKADIVPGIFGSSSKSYNVIPYKVYDAMALGRPVISGSGGASDEALENHHDCLLVGRTPEEIAAGLLLLAQDRDLRKRLAVQSRDTYHRKFHTSVTSKLMTSAVQNLIRVGTK